MKERSNMYKWCILQTIVQLNVLLRMGKAEEVNIIPFIKSEISTSISSTSNFNTPTASWESRNVIDNKAFGSPDTCRCCAGTLGTDIPWIQIDLRMIYTITRIQITGRPDNTNREQFQDIYVFVSNTSVDTSNGSLIYEGNPTNYTRFELRQHLPTSFRYLVIRRFSVGFLTICEVDLAAEEVNIISLIKSEVSTSISSTSDWHTPASSWESRNVIDNKAYGSPDTCRCCAGTSGSDVPWIQIDLGMIYTITRIQITGRPDNTATTQFQDIYVFVSNTSVNISSNGSLVYQGNPTSYNRFELRQHLPSSFRYLIIRRFKTGLLTICEVELFSLVPKCDVGRFGKACSQKCHCADKNTCNVWIGKCKTPGCLLGWTGQACNKECAFRRFGINCSTECHCANNSTCNKINGICSTGLCEPGWYGQSCSQGCPFRRFGENCSTECNCFNNSTCDKINGICSTGLCDPGWKGQSCSQVCDSGTYGNQCSNSCGHCVDGTTCNNVNGTCFGGCIDGYFYNATDRLCKTQCDGIHFGEGCSKTCHCKSSKPCKNGNGECPNGECAAGWTSQACDTMCTNGSYGYECKNVCGKCAHGCNNVNGTCSGGCLDGYMLTDVLCKTICQSGFYGHNCSKPCGHCNKDLACNISSGFCFHGCNAGFNGHLCETSCRNSTFGPNCANPCHCSGNSQCDIFQGNCSNDCDIGWAGFNCSIDLNILRRNSTSATALQSRMYSTCSANRAIDGIDAPVNPLNDVNLCEACSVARNDNSVQFSWWQLDLGSMFLVKFIKIFGRPNQPEQSQNITGYINNISMEINQTGTMLSINASKGHVFLKELVKPRLFRYLKIQKQDTVLTLCEVKLYEAECSVETFGDRCSNPCKCADKLNCDKIKGTCISKGCLPGWEGAACNKSCGHQHFGPDCKYKCHCFSDGSCAKDSGECNNSRCDPGWELSNCSKACSFPHFGDNCRDTCHCLNNSECDHRDGKCDIKSCEAGWQGESCNNVCDHRRFGINCSSVCNCRDNTSCNATTGQCNTGLCDPGWLGNSCDKVCDHRRFGINCSSVCNCRDNTSCNATTGQCNTGLCDPGWLGNSCDKVCDHQRFGINCSTVCNCRDNTSCNAITGHCKTVFCDPGWLGLSCDKVCKHRTYGLNCSSRCYCHRDSSCNHITGQCLSGTCDPGWQGLSCDQACNFPHFGDNCNDICHCIDNSRCNHINGSCDRSLCDAGWHGDSCNDACNGTFGYNCSNKCHCDRDENCSPTDGKCLLGGCQSGWQGDNCSIEMLPLSQDQPSSTTAAVAGGVSATVIVIALGVIIGFIIFKKRNASAERNSKRNACKDKTTNLKETRKSNLYGNDNKSFDGIAETNINESVSNDYYSFGECSGIKICELWDYIYKKMENNCEQFYKEFKTLPYGLVHSHKSADEIANKGKNRYREMYAYDHTRVILSDVEDGKNTDYINACYIDGYEKVKKFVASQGPTKQMIDDFWRMVWQLKSDKIVMLTNLIEMGTPKCMQYWPKEDEGNECTFDKVIVKLLNTETFLDYNIRHLEVRMNDEPRRRIRQFHFKSWPDKDVPDSTWCLVYFWRVVDTNAISKAGPIVVHCSAGVGRTGTFIGLDNMVNQARVEGFVRPLQVVQTLRQQRVNMVQTKEQYVYLHEAVADAMLFGTHIVWTKQFGDVISFMTQNEKNNTRTRLQIQFELIEESVVNSSSEVSESPEYSNVETLLSESDAYRPKLKNRGSKFVQQLRAMYIPNYKGKSTFLVSMSPDKDTMEEFWSLVDDNNIKTVIMLTEQSLSSYQSSCDLGSSSKGGSIFSVNKIEEKIRKGYTQRTFTFKESGREEEDYLTTVKQFEYTAWKDGYPSPGDTTSFLDMIEAVLKWQPHLSESQPILVFCGDGCTRSGIVCVLLNELQRIKYEGGHVNIVESVKMMKKRQRHLIGSYEQYKFCFDLMMDHIKRTDVYQNL